MSHAALLRLCFVSMAVGSQLPAAQNPAFVLSAAGGAPNVAPGSIASLYGVVLPIDPVQGQPNKDGQLPTSLAGYSVDVGGTPAALTYVGPSQVNFVLPQNVRGGKGQVSLKLGGQEVATADANATPVAPAIFTYSQGDREFGAILNAVTFHFGPFAPDTPEIVGCDARTRLAVFATGMAFATSKVRMRDIEVVAQASDGGPTWQLEVQAALPSSFMGLDQINAIVPYGMGVGTYNLWIVENGVASNRVQFDLLGRAGAADGTCIGHVGIARMPGQPGAQFVGTVSLAYPAPVEGVTLALQSGDAGVAVPATVTIPRSQISATFPITVSAPHTSSPISVTASVNGGSWTGNFEEGAPCVNGVWLATTGIVAGQSIGGTVQVTDPAAAGGTSVTLMSSNPSVQVGPTVMVPAGSLTAAFAVSTAQSFMPDRTTIIAQGICGGSAVSLNLVVFPCISAVALSAGTVAGGGALTGTVTMNAPVLAGGLTVNLKSSDPNVQVPATVLVPEGQTSVTFAVKTTGAGKTMAYVTGSMNCGSASAMLTVNP